MRSEWRTTGAGLLSTLAAEMAKWLGVSEFWKKHVW